MNVEKEIYQNQKNINELFNNTTRLIDKLVEKNILTHDEKLEIEGSTQII